jgi:hypothetical protein
MIHSAIKPYTQTKSSGSGFKRQTLIRCFSGPHFMYDEIGRLEIKFSSGKKTWFVQVKATGNPASFFLEPSTSYLDAIAKAESAVNLFYAEQLGSAPMEATNATN